MGNDIILHINNLAVGADESVSLKTSDGVLFPLSDINALTMDVLGNGHLKVPSLPPKPPVVPEGYLPLFPHEGTRCWIYRDPQSGRIGIHDIFSGSFREITGFDADTLRPLKRDNPLAERLCQDKNGHVVDEHGVALPEGFDPSTLVVMSEKKPFLHSDNAGRVLNWTSVIEGITRVGDENIINISGDYWWYLPSDPTRVVYYNKIIPGLRGGKEGNIKLLGFTEEWNNKHTYVVNIETGEVFFEGNLLSDVDGRKMTRIGQTVHFSDEKSLILSNDRTPQIIPLTGEKADQFEDLGQGFWRNMPGNILFKHSRLITSVDIPSFVPLNNGGHDKNGVAVLSADEFIHVTHLGKLLEYPFFQKLFATHNPLRSLILELIALKKLSAHFDFKA